jgi:nitrogen fixation NifU-like protein
MSGPLDALYREAILEHAREPHHRGRLAQPTLVHRGANPVCGDRIELSLRLAGGRLAEVGFEGQGCAISQASASLLTDLVHGRTLEEVEAVRGAFMRMLSGDGAADEAVLGDAVALRDVRRFPRRVACAALAWTTLREALDLGVGRRPE